MPAELPPPPSLRNATEAGEPPTTERVAYALVDGLNQQLTRRQAAKVGAKEADSETPLPMVGEIVNSVFPKLLTVCKDNYRQARSVLDRAGELTSFYKKEDRLTPRRARAIGIVLQGMSLELRYEAFNRLLALSGYQGKKLLFEEAMARVKQLIPILEAEKGAEVDILELASLPKEEKPPPQTAEALSWEILKLLAVNTPSEAVIEGELTEEARWKVEAVAGSILTRADYDYALMLPAVDFALQLAQENQERLDDAFPDWALMMGEVRLEIYSRMTTDVLRGKGSKMPEVKRISAAVVAALRTRGLEAGLAEEATAYRRKLEEAAKKMDGETGALLRPGEKAPAKAAIPTKIKAERARKLAREKAAAAAMVRRRHQVLFRREATIAAALMVITAYFYTAGFPTITLPRLFKPETPIPPATAARYEPDLGRQRVVVQPPAEIVTASTVEPSAEPPPAVSQQPTRRPPDKGVRVTPIRDVREEPRRQEEERDVSPTPPAEGEQKVTEVVNDQDLKPDIKLTATPTATPTPTLEPTPTPTPTPAKTLEEIAYDNLNADYNNNAVTVFIPGYPQTDRTNDVGGEEGFKATAVKKNPIMIDGQFQPDMEGIEKNPGLYRVGKDGPFVLWVHNVQHRMNLLAPGHLTYKDWLSLSLQGLYDEYQKNGRVDQIIMLDDVSYKVVKVKQVSSKTPFVEMLEDFVPYGDQLYFIGCSNPPNPFQSNINLLRIVVMAARIK